MATERMGVFKRNTWAINKARSFQPWSYLHEWCYSTRSSICYLWVLLCQFHEKAFHIFKLSSHILAENDTLAPSYEIDEKFFDQKIKELVLRYNYTLNPIGVYEAIKYMYTYWPNPHNKTNIREQYIHVCTLILNE